MGLGRFACGQFARSSFHNSPVPRCNFIHRSFHSIFLSSTHPSGDFFTSFCFHRASSPFHMRGSSSYFCSIRYSVTMESRQQRRSREARNYDVTFVTSQRGMKLPVVSGYVFVCKDKARKRFSCRTRSCRTTLTLKRDENGVYIDETQVHTHPPHETIITSLKHKEN